MADDVLRQGIQGITDLITESGVINLDFADVKTVMSDRGIAHMGVGVGRGENRVIDAVKEAIGSPLLETSIDGAERSCSISWADTISECWRRTKLRISLKKRRHAMRISYSVHPSRKIWRTEIRITVIATGFDSEEEGEVESIRPAASSRREQTGGERSGTPGGTGRSVA